MQMLSDTAESRSRLEEMADEAILLLSRHEPAVFELLVDRYREPLFRAAFKILRNREEAEDVVQESFLKMYRNAEKFQKLAGIEFKSWAYKVTINTAISQYRKIKRGAVAVEDVSVFAPLEESGASEYRAFLADAELVVRDTLSKMPGHLEVVLRRYYLEDKSYEDIAREERISVSTLKMRLFRARKIFKKMSGGFEL